MSIQLSHYLIVSAVLFAIGSVGFLARRNALVALMSIELMLNAVNLTLVAFNRWQPTVEIAAATRTEHGPAQTAAAAARIGREQEALQAAVAAHEEPEVLQVRRAALARTQAESQPDRLVPMIPHYGQVFAFFVIAVAAAEAAVGLAIVLALYRVRKTIRTDDADLLKG